MPNTATELSIVDEKNIRPADLLDIDVKRVTQLLQVERDGNPLRRYSHVSPFIGKLAPLDADALHDISRLTLASLPPLPHPTLVIGMTESSLLLSWFLAKWQEPPMDLRFTTRKKRHGAQGRTFREPHSHGPEHFLALEVGARYEQVVVIEDELTTGATLRNLILTISDVSSQIFVVTLNDMRPNDLRLQLQDEMAALGVQLRVVDLSQPEENVMRPCEARHPEELPLHDCNPFGRTIEARQEARLAIDAAWNNAESGIILAVGECVDLALALWETVPRHQRPPLQQVTRSPWLVDGKVIHSRQTFEGDGTTSRYFLYNWQVPATSHALVIGEARNVSINAQVKDFLSEQGIIAHCIVVSGS